MKLTGFFSLSFSSSAMSSYLLILSSYWETNDIISAIYQEADEYKQSASCYQYTIGMIPRLHATRGLARRITGYIFVMFSRFILWDSYNLYNPYKKQKCQSSSRD